MVDGSYRQMLGMALNINQQPQPVRLTSLSQLQENSTKAQTSRSCSSTSGDDTKQTDPLEAEPWAY